jgi:dynein light chain 4
MLQEMMCKKYGGGWHVLMGEGFGFEVTNDHNSLLYMFYGGLTACLIWKCN